MPDPAPDAPPPAGPDARASDPAPPAPSDHDGGRGVGCVIAVFLAPLLYILSTGPVVFVLVRTGLHMNPYVGRVWKAYVWPLRVLTEHVPWLNDLVKAYLHLFLPDAF